MEATRIERSPASRGRTIAFRVIAALGGLLAAAFSIPFALLAPFEAGPDQPLRADVLSVRAPSAPLAVLLSLSLIPAVAYLLTWSEVQRTAAVGDPHAKLHHYSGMAVTGIGFALAGIAVAARGSGWPIVAWFVGFSWAAMGVASLAWPDHVSAFDSAWAWASVAFGVAFVAVAEWQARSAPRADARA